MTIPRVVRPESRPDDDNNKFIEEPSGEWECALETTRNKQRGQRTTILELRLCMAKGTHHRLDDYRVGLSLANELFQLLLLV